MSKVAIHGFSQSTYVWTVRAICAAKGVEADFNAISVPDSKSEEHLARQPFGKVPAFQHGDFKLYETSAITRYVDRNFDGQAFTPSDNQRAARMDQWVSVIDSYLYSAAVLNYAFGYIFPGTEDGSPNRELIEAGLPRLEQVLGVLEAGVEGPWMLGDELTLADFFLVPLLAVTSMFPEGKELLGKHPKLSGVLGHSMGNAAFSSTMPSK